MAKFTVKAESLPERCDICHQTDMFDPATGYCARCSFVPIPMPDPTLGEDRTQPFMTPQPFAPPQPYYQPPIVQPTFGPPPGATTTPYAPPPIPQPFPYQPPVSPLAPVPPHIVHEQFVPRPPAPPKQHLFFRHIGPEKVSEWVGFRDALFGGLVGAIPSTLIGATFLLTSTPWLWLGFVFQGLFASGFAGFQAGNRLRKARTAVPANSIRQRCTLYGGLGAAVISILSFFAWFLIELRLNPLSPFTVAFVVGISLLPYAMAFVLFDLLGGLMATLTVEYLESRHLVQTLREKTRS